jgi:hypothetical protein
LHSEIILIILGIALGVLKLVSWLITEKSNKEVIGKIVLLETKFDCGNRKVEKIYNIIEKCDADGIPLAYFSRSYVDVQKEMVTALQDFHYVQKEMIFVQKEMINTLKRIEERI